MFILSGVLLLLSTLIVLAIPLPAKEMGAGIGNQVCVYANMLWSLYFTRLAGLVMLFFKQTAEAR